MQIQNETGKKSFLSPCLFLIQWKSLLPLETKPDVQFWGENGLGDPGAALHYQNKPFSKQTIRHS